MVKTLPVSPLAPKKSAKPKALSGMRMSALASGARYQGRDDVLLIELDGAARIAGVFTSSKMPSAAVDLSRDHLTATRGRARAILVNAGNANAFTGAAGAKAAALTAQAAAQKIGCEPHDVLVASTVLLAKCWKSRP